MLDHPRAARHSGLDGLRGIAVALVVANHAFGLDLPMGGAVGVAVFFTLSGYLITRILLQEHDRTERISIAAFYARRARRLVPALLVFLTAMLLLGATLGPDFGRPRDVWPVVLYVNNLTYLDGTRSAAALTHTWSLSIEEQFYLVFPLVLLVVLPRLGARWLTRIVLAAVVVSVAARVAFWHDGVLTWRIYYGTDTNACLLLLGVALAISLRRHRGVTWPFAIPGVVILLSLSFMPAHDLERALLPVIASAVTVGIIAATKTNAPAWLTSRWLVLLGRRSYGLYLWHWPLLIVIWPELGGGPIMLVGCLAAAWGVTLLSWRYVEEPFLRPRPDAERLRRRWNIAVPAATQSRSSRTTDG